MDFAPSLPSPGIGDGELAKIVALRCRLRDSPKIPDSPKSSLLRLLDAELRFLSSPRATPSSPISSNVVHLAAVFHFALHPSVCAICPSSPHADLVCTFRRSPVWVVISARNPAHVLCSTEASFRSRVASVVAAARTAAVAVRPELVLLVFARGVVDAVATALADEFGATEVGFLDDHELLDELPDGWVDVSSELPCVASFRLFKIEIEGNNSAGRFHRDGEFAGDMINLDTTALVAMVSEISNGGAEHLALAEEAELFSRFKGNASFVQTQAKSELEDPILPRLEKALAGKQSIVCHTVWSEFEELVRMCAGPNEKERAAKLLKHLRVVPDDPSARMMDLPTTRKLAMKNKITFGTGDQWRMPMLTANAAFVRAVAQAGMSLLTVEHRPRALAGA